MTVHLSLPEAETFTAAGNTFTILDDGGGTAGRLGLLVCELAPGWMGPPQHVHAVTDESWFVLTGAVRFTTGDESFCCYILPVGHGTARHTPHVRQRRRRRAGHRRSAPSVRRTTSPTSAPWPTFR